MIFTIPNGFTEIKEDRLSLIIKQVIEAYVRLDTKEIGISRWELEDKVYDLVIYELKKSRLFYKGLTREGVLKIYRKFVIQYAPSGKSFESIMSEYDDLVWKKLNGIPFDRDRLMLLKSKLNV
jgi:hypothetical protein